MSESTLTATSRPLLPDWFTALPEYHWLTPLDRIDILAAEADTQLAAIPAKLQASLAESVAAALEELGWQYQEATWRLNEAEARYYADFLADYWQPVPMPYGCRRNATPYPVTARGILAHVPQEGPPKLFPTYYALTLPLEHRGVLV